MKSFKNAFVIFILVGVVLIGIGVFIQKNNTEFMKNAIQTIGTIEKIEYDTLDESYDVYVSYFDLEENKYYEKLNYYSSNMRVGKEIEIYYDEGNPTKFHASGESLASVILYFMGAIFLLVGAIPTISKVKSNKLSNKLKENGIMLNAVIKEVRINTKYSVNNQNPYQIVGSYEYNGNVYEAISENIWYEVRSILEVNNITTLPVYISSDKPNKYYLDISILEKQEEVSDFNQNISTNNSNL